MRKRTGYLIRRGKTFYAVWNVTGKKFTQTTGKQDRREAETELRRIMEPFVAGDEVTTLQNIAAKIEGRTADIARYEEATNPALTLTAAWSAYMTAPGKPDSGEGTQSNYEGHYAVFHKWMKEKHPDAPKLRDVSATIAGEFATHLTNERKVSANTFNKFVRFLELLFRVVKEPARLTGNPWEGIKRKKFSTAKTSRRELTTDELKTIYDATSGEMRLLFMLGIHTGLRLGDCATLRWAECDLRRGFIYRIPNKIARGADVKPVNIPIHAELFNMLSEQPAKSRGAYVLPETEKLYRENPPELSKRIQALFDRCKVQTRRTGTGEGTKKRAVVEVGFHSLRHTFVSLCREYNTPLAVVEAIVGHSNPAMTRHYTHVSELAAATAIRALPFVMSGKPPALLPAPKTVDAATVRAMAEKLNAKNWKETREELLKLV